MRRERQRPANPAGPHAQRRHAGLRRVELELAKPQPQAGDRSLEAGIVSRRTSSNRSTHMGRGTRGWLIGLGVATAAGVTVVSLAPAAGASTGALRRPASGLSAAAPGSSYVPSGRALTFGMRGRAVKALQQRLNFLHYYAGSADGYFGWDTMEAVWAFKEVQSGRAEPRNPDVVNLATQRQLVHPKLPRVLIRHATWSRIEINKDVGVLVLYRHRRIELISHVSTAAS